jgi:Na+-driven multidrug efflux pump
MKAVMAPLIVLTILLPAVPFPFAELFLDRYHVDAVWWSFPISSVLSSILAIAYHYGGWRHAGMRSASCGSAMRG